MYKKGFTDYVIGDSIEENRRFVMERNGKANKHESISDSFANEIIARYAGVVDIRADKKLHYDAIQKYLHENCGKH